MGNKISAEKMKQIKGRIAKVGVFVNEPYESLMRTVEEYRLDMVQLHGDEIPRYCEQVANYITVVKAFRLSDNDPLDWMLKPFDDAADMYMLDTMGAGYGGTGKKLDWNTLTNTSINKLFLLSGGIEPGDEEGLKEFLQQDVAKKLFALDINTGFEIAPGVKNIERITEFVTAIKKQV
jgi:phosphoribosylanthranilate isomerase